MDKLENMRIFTAIVDKQGFSSAAEYLNTSPASVSNKLKALERHYGVKLLNRTTRTISLTFEGEQFYQLSKSSLKNIKKMEDLIFAKSESLSGVLRISATRDLGKNVVEPILDKFIKLHSGIIPHLILTDEVLPVYKYRLDVTFRYSHMEDSQLISRKLLSSRRILCASPRYLKQYGTPERPRDLLNHKCIGSLKKGEPITRWQFHNKQNDEIISIKPTRSSNDGEILKRWALAGHGIALKSWVDVKSDVEAGRLELVLEDYAHDFSNAAKEADLHLIYPYREHQPARTSAFINFVIRCFNSETT